MENKFEVSIIIKMRTQSIISFLKNAGWSYETDRNFSEDDNWLYCNRKTGTIEPIDENRYHEILALNEPMYICRDDERMFKTLSKLRPDAVLDQWFVCIKPFEVKTETGGYSLFTRTGDMFLCQRPDEFFVDNPEYFRKADYQEVMDYINRTEKPKKLFKDMDDNDEIYFIIKNRVTGIIEDDIMTAIYTGEGCVGCGSDEIVLYVELVPDNYKYSFAVNKFKSSDIDFFEDEFCYVFSTREEAEDSYDKILKYRIEDLKINAEQLIQSANQLEEKYFKQ